MMRRLWMGGTAILLACGGLGGDPARRATVTPVTQENGVTILANTDTDGARIALAGDELLIGCFDARWGWLLATPKAGGPTRLVTWLPRVIKGIEVDGDNAWVATWGGLFRVSLSSGEKTRIGSFTDAHALALSETHVAWLASDGLWVQPRPDGTPVQLYADSLQQGSVGLFGEHVYIAYYKGLFRVPLDGGAATQLAEHASPNDGARMFARGDRLLVDLGVGGPTAFPMAGGEPEPACTRVWDHSRGFLATDDGMYWGAHEVHYGAVDNRRDPSDWHRYTPGRQKDGSTGGVFHCPYGQDSSTTNLAPNTEYILDIVADETHVYWADKWTGDVGRSPR